MVDFIVFMLVGAFGLLVFGVIFLVRRALAGDRRTHAAVEEIEVNFAELKRRVETLSLRTAKLDEDNRRFRDAIQRLEAAPVQPKPTVAVPTEPVVPASDVIQPAPLPVVTPAPAPVVTPAPAPVVMPAPAPVVMPAAPPVVAPAAPPVVAAAAPPVVAPVPAPVVQTVATRPKAPPSPAHPSLAHRVLVQADSAPPVKQARHHVAEHHEGPPAATPPARTGEDWEALVGGNWLNKAGVIVFVIGLSLFLGYSLTQFGPLGRVAIGWAVSIALLGGGVVLERKPRYALFARGLVAGGWAGCYFTAFAMYALPAARVIQSPLAGTLVLLAVAGAMIAHSLRYKSETVTALTYFIAFATLNIAPLSSFSLFASAPLAVSLLAISYRHKWSPMSVLGVIFTYGSFLLRMAMSTAPPSQSDLTIAQSILALYWVLFETFDLLEVRRQREGDVLRTLFPLNAAGLIGTSMLLWGDRPGSSLYVLYALTAVAYLVSSVIRAKLRPAAGLAETDTLQRAWSGGYEGAITAAAALAAVAIGLRFSGIRLAAGLMLEGEFLLLSGLRLNTRYLRGLASVVLLTSFAMSLPVLFGPSQNMFVMVGRSWDSWIPIALVMAVVFHINRVIGRGRELVLAEPFYSTLGTALIVIIVGQATPLRFLGLAWLILALALTELSIRFDVDDLRRQAYAVAALAAIAFSSLISNQIVDARSWTLAMSAAMAFLLAARISRPAGTVGDDERIFARGVASWGATTLAAAAIWYAVPHQYAGLAWLLLALALAEASIRFDFEELRRQAYGVALLGLMGSSPVISNGIQNDQWWWTLAMSAAVAYVFAARVSRPAGKVTDEERTLARIVASWAATALAATSVWYAVPHQYAGLGWLILALALAEASIRLDLEELRRQAYAVALLGLMAFAPVISNGIQNDQWWWTLAMSAAVAYLFAARVSRPVGTVTDEERTLARTVASWGATTLAATAVWYAVPHQYAGIAWLVLAWPLLEIGLSMWPECLVQAAALGAVAVSQILATTQLGAGPVASDHPSLVLAVAGTLGAAAAIRLFAFGNVKRPEQIAFRDPCALIGIVFLALLAWQALPAPIVVLAWSAFGLLLIEAGHGVEWPFLEKSGHTLTLVAFCRLFFANFTATGGAWGISTRLLTSLPLVPLFYYLAQSLHSRQSSGADVLRRGSLERLYIWMAPIVVAVLMRFELGRVFTASGWAVFGLALLVLAVKRRDVDYRIQGYVLFGMAFVRGWTTNFEAPGFVNGLSLELAVATVVIGSLYAAEFVVPRFWHDRRSTPEAGEPGHPLLLWVDLHARELFSILATILLGAVLFHYVPAGLLTVAWAMQGLVLLVAGFSSREPILRRSGLVLLGVCLVKVLGYDSRQLETLARILSFMLLGAVLIVVSWIYTRFGLKLRQYL